MLGLNRVLLPLNPVVLLNLRVSPEPTDGYSFKSLYEPIELSRFKAFGRESFRLYIFFLSWRLTYLM